MRAALFALALLFGWLHAAGAAVPPDRLAVLHRGVNITGWFRFAADRSPAALASYLSGAAIRGLRDAGFTFVRLPFDPAFASSPALRRVLIAQTTRLERAGLGVVLVPAPADWKLESRNQDRSALLALWAELAPDLRSLSRSLTFPELVNEPVFAGEAAQWQALREQGLSVIRAGLPESTVILSGPDWSSIAGLTGTTPSRDRNVIYTIHFYDPSELTALAAYRPNLDRAALAQMPFPADDPARCQAAAESGDPATAALIGFVCAQHWDAERIESRFAAVAAWSRRAGAPVLLGEFGASTALNRPARLSWIAAVRTAAERAGLGWALWGYDDVMGFNLSRPPPRVPVLDPALLGALGLIYLNPGSPAQSE